MLCVVLYDRVQCFFCYESASLLLTPQKPSAECSYCAIETAVDRLR